METENKGEDIEKEKNEENEEQKEITEKKEEVTKAEIDEDITKLEENKKEELIESNDVNANVDKQGELIKKENENDLNTNKEGDKEVDKNENEQKPIEEEKKENEIQNNTTVNETKPKEQEEQKEQEQPPQVKEETLLQKLIPSELSQTTETPKMIITDYFSTVPSKKTQVNISVIQPQTITISEHPTEIVVGLPKNIADQKEEINQLFQKLQSKTIKNKQCSTMEFFKKNRHYFIMTDGGLPVYSRYGDEVENNSIFATFSAMITKFTAFLSDQNTRENIHFIANEKNLIVFVKEDELIFIALSKKKDSISLLTSQLKYLLKQLMSLLTTQLYARLIQNPSKCLTALDGTDILFEQMIKFTSHSLVSLLDAYQVLPLPNRDKLNKICNDNIGNAVLCLILTPNEVVSYAHKEGFDLIASDVILLQNFIYSSPSLRVQESWTPFCAPGLSQDMYLQLYCKYSSENIGTVFVIDSTDANDFMKFKELAENIYRELIQNNILNQIISQEQKYSSHLKKDQINGKKINELSDDELIDELLKRLEITEQEQPLKNANLVKSAAQLNHSNTTVNKQFGATASINVDPKPQIYVDIIMKDIVYGICQHMKLNQFFLINFNSNYHNISKEEKRVLKEYINLIDKYYECGEGGKNKDGFYYYEKGKTFTNVIQIQGGLMLIASFSFFIEYEEVSKKMKELMKQIKEKENYYFINVK